MSALLLNLHKKGDDFMNLLELCEQFVEVQKKPFLKIGTYERYKSTFVHIPRIALEELLPDDLQLMLNNMIYKGYSLTTIKHVKIVVTQALRHAQKRGQYPPYDLTLEMPKRRKTKIRAFSEADQQLLIANIDKTFYGDLFLALLYSGCRAGELIALEWSDIDFRNNNLSINKTDWRGDVHAPKTENSVRTVPMCEDLRRIFLRKYNVGCTGRVFRNTLGTSISYRSLLEAWNRFQTSSGINTVAGLHILRHTFATNALRAGLNYKVLAEILGHGSVAVTMDLYCDVTEEDKQIAIKQFSDFFSSAPKKKKGLF